MDRLIGTVLDNTYRIERMLGQGGMGAVFLAQDVTLNRPVAIKVMHSHIAQQPGFRERFLQEARAVATLDHPGIVRVYGFSRDPNLLYIVMAFIQGQNLADLLESLAAQEMMVSLPEALGIIELVAEALAYAHRRGVYHRDIKPGNIILRPLEPGQSTTANLPFQPVVTDFGLAKLAEGGIISLPGTSMGTPAYMAPEQCEGKSVDGRADIYALGVVLYELVTGRRPFEVHTLTEAIRAHTQEPPPPPRSLVPTLPSQLEQIILKALAKRPEDRYQMAEELAQAVRAVRLALGAEVPEDATITPTGRASLATMISREAPSAPSVERWPTPPSAPVPGGRIVILQPDGSTRVFPIEGRQKITIGREPDNTLVLADNQVSRHHAQITLSEGKFSVTDLNSTNGTWLDNNKLLPGIAEAWRPNQTLRIGQHWLRLEVEPPTPSEPAPGAVTYAPSAPPVEEPIQVALEPASLAVKPGVPALLTVRLLNRQQQVDHLTASVEGLPGAWVTLPEQPLRLAPGDSGTLSLRFQVPRSPEATAGMHDFVVRVHSQSSPSQKVARPAQLNIEPFRELALEISPRTVTNEGQGRIAIRNMGNALESVVLTIEDPDESLRPLGASNPVAVPPGEQRQVVLPLGMRTKRPLIGNVETHAFSVHALANGQKVATTQGTLRIKPVLPTWAIPLVTTLALLLCGASILAYTTIQRDRQAKATAEAMAVAAQTQTAEAHLAQEQAQQTQTAQAVALALTSTQVALQAQAQAGEAATAAVATAAALAATFTAQAKTPTGAPPTEAPATATATPTPTETPPPTATPIPFFAPGEAKSFAFEAADVGTLEKVCLQHDNSDASPDWFVDRVLVGTGTGYTEVIFNRWIAVDKEDRALIACTSLPTPVPSPTPTPTPTPSGGSGGLGGIILVQPTLLVLIIPTPTPTLGFYLPGPALRIPLTIRPLILTKDYNVIVITGNVSEAGTNAHVSIQLYGSKGNTGWISLTP